MLIGRAVENNSKWFVSSFRGLSSRIGSCSYFASRSASSVEPVLDSDRSNDEGLDLNWDKLGFSVVETDYMYVMKCSLDGEFSCGKLNRYGKIDLSPASGVLNYGQGLYEGLKAYRKRDGRGYLLFRPQENALRMQLGAERMCMPSPTVDQFIDAVKQTVVANKRWVPPLGKGSLYVRPLLLGSGSVLGLAPAPEYTFVVYSSPVGTYFKTPVTEYVLSLIQPGKPISNVCFKVYGYISMSQAISFLSDFKLGHYMKIPPKSMFLVQFLQEVDSSTLTNRVV